MNDPHDNNATMLDNEALWLSPDHMVDDADDEQARLEAWLEAGDREYEEQKDKELEL